MMKFFFSFYFQMQLQHYGARCGINFVTQRVKKKENKEQKEKKNAHPRKYISIKFLNCKNNFQ